MTEYHPPKRPGRPPMAPADKLAHIVSFRVSANELATILQRAGIAGQTSVNAFAKAAALNQSVTVRSEGSNQLDALAVTALNRLGVNLNQIARRLNLGKRPDIPAIEALTLRIDSIIDELLTDDSARP